MKKVLKKFQILGAFLISDSLIRDSQPCIEEEFFLFQINCNNGGGILLGVVKFYVKLLPSMSKVLC